MIDLTDASWCVFGLRGSGKSWLLKHILDSSSRHLIYDPMDEHQGYHRYVPTDRRSSGELNDFLVTMAIPWKPRLLVIDEANVYIPPKPHPLVSGVDDLVTFARHWGMSVGYCARRPVQFHSDIVELSQFLFIFGLHGRNDYIYLESLFEGLGDTVRGLNRHEFAMLEGGSRLQVHAPIEKPAGI